MLNRDEIELIHREIDGANTPDESAAFRMLLARDSEARAFEADLRQLTRLFDHVGEREPPPRLKRAILDALPALARASPTTTIVRRFLVQLRRFTGRIMEEAIMTKQRLILAGAAVAIVVVVAGLVTGYPPLTGGAGTIGGDIPGVQQAARYQGRTMTQADVTLQNPEVQTLLQNDQVLALVQSEAFREVMNNELFRELQSNELYHELLSNELYHELMSNELYRDLMSNELYHELMSNELYRDLMENELFRDLQAKGAFRDLQSTELQRNAAYRELQSNELFLKLQSNELFLKLQSSLAFRDLQANEAYYQLQSSELFRSLSRSPELSQSFMSEAMRAQP